MSRANSIYRLKKHINIGGKNHVAYADAAWIKVYCKQPVDHERFYFDYRSAETLNMRRINTDIHRVCQIEFTILDLWGQFHQKAYACRKSTTVVNIDLL